MARWEFEQWQAARAARDLARNPFGLLIVGVIVTAVASAVPRGKPDQTLTAEEYVARAQYCEGRLACQESMKNVEQAIKLNPQLAKAYVTRSSLLLRRSQGKEVQAALQDYRMARSLYQQQGKSDEATMLEKLILQVDRQILPKCLPADPGKVGVCL